MVWCKIITFVLKSSLFPDREVNLLRIYFYSGIFIHSHRWRPDLVRQFRYCSMNHEQYERGERSVFVRAKSAFEYLLLLSCLGESSQEHHQYVHSATRCETDQLQFRLVSSNVLMLMNTFAALWESFLIVVVVQFNPAHLSIDLPIQHIWS